MSAEVIMKDDSCLLTKKKVEPIRPGNIYLYYSIFVNVSK